MSNPWANNRVNTVSDKWNGRLLVRPLRWLLQVDRPVPPHTDERIAAEMARNYRWNFTVSVLDGASGASRIVPDFPPSTDTVPPKAGRLLGLL